jgi:hypothetical protein
MAYKKRVRQSAQRRKAVRFALEIDKEKWVIGAKEISELREELNTTDVCPVTGKPYGSGMDSSCLDHDHSTGRVRGCLSSRANLWLGSIEKYLKKRLGNNADLLESLENLVEYLKQSKDLEPILHGAMIEAEKKRVSRWKIETLYDKLVEKGLTLNDVTDYTKHQITEVWLNQFIKELESTV